MDHYHMLTSIKHGVKIKEKRFIKNASVYEQFHIFSLSFGQKVLFS